MRDLEFELDILTDKVTDFSENSETLTKNDDPSIFFNGFYKIWIPINKRIDISEKAGDPTANEIVEEVQNETEYLDQIQNEHLNDFL